MASTTAKSILRWEWTQCLWARNQAVVFVSFYCLNRSENQEGFRLQAGADDSQFFGKCTWPFNRLCPPPASDSSL